MKPSTLHVKRIGPTLTPDRSRVLLRPFRPSTDDISRHIMARVMAVPEAEVLKLLGHVIGEFADRHERVEDFFRNRFAQVAHHLDPGALPIELAALIERSRNLYERVWRLDEALYSETPPLQDNPVMRQLNRLRSAAESGRAAA